MPNCFSFFFSKKESGFCYTCLKWLNYVWEEGNTKAVKGVPSLYSPIQARPAFLRNACLPAFWPKSGPDMPVTRKESSLWKNEVACSWQLSLQEEGSYILHHLQLLANWRFQPWLHLYLQCLFGEKAMLPIDITYLSWTYFYFLQLCHVSKSTTS